MHAAPSTSPCNSFCNCCDFFLVRAQVKEPQRGVGTCLKSHSSKVAGLEFRARSVVTYSNDEKNNDNDSSRSGKSMSGSHLLRALHVPSTWGAADQPPLSPQEIFVHSAHGSEDKVKGVLSSRCVKAPRQTGR